jgi:hypothetical protein
MFSLSFTSSSSNGWKKPPQNPSAEMLAKINENNFLSLVCPSSSRQMQKGDCGHLIFGHAGLNFEKYIFNLMSF